MKRLDLTNHKFDGRCGILKKYIEQFQKNLQGRMEETDGQKP